MNTLQLCLLLVLSALAGQVLANPDSFSFFMHSTGENKHSMDVPYVSFDDMAFQSLKSDALSTTTTTTTTADPETTANATTEGIPSTNSKNAPTTEASIITTTTAATSSTTAKDKSKSKKKRHGRKHRSYKIFY